MSKYKYEKELMFSNRRLEEIELFLQNQDAPLDLPAIRDNHKNTVLHHNAYHNQPKILEFYLKYYRKTLEKQHFSITQIKLYTRYFLDEPNAQGYTASHYAAYRGNISVLKILEKYQAQFNLTNHLQMNMLHLAAQGDKPPTFLYLHQKHFDINQKDAKQSTPLHWASFAASQKIVEYLLAQPNIELNPVDTERFTPLHLATSYGNSKVVKKLLIGGADRTLKNNKGQTALDIAISKQFEGITRMIDDNYSCIDRIKIICNAKVKYKPCNKSIHFPLCFLLCSILAALMIFGVISIKSNLIFILQGVLSGITTLLFISLAFGGKTFNKDNKDYGLYAQSQYIYHLCMNCVREMHPRQHHCPVCKTCISQYDHHCTWINNCVGKHNIVRFNIFLILLQITFIWLSFLAVSILICLIENSKEQYLFAFRQWNQEILRPLAYSLAFFILILVLFFALPLLFLIFVQIKNLLLGKTTYQRFSKARSSILTRQSSLLADPEQPPSASLKNCIEMCCDSELDCKFEEEHSNSTSSSYIKQH